MNSAVQPYVDNIEKWKNQFDRGKKTGKNRFVLLNKLEDLSDNHKQVRIKLVTPTQQSMEQAKSEIAHNKKTGRKRKTSTRSQKASGSKRKKSTRKRKKSTRKSKPKAKKPNRKRRRSVKQASRVKDIFHSVKRKI